MSIPFSISKRQNRPCLTLPLIGLGLLMLSACSTTQKAPIDMTGGLNCGLLGKDCGNRLVAAGKESNRHALYQSGCPMDQLQTGDDQPGNILEGETTQVSAADQQTLVNYFNEQLHNQLGKQFQVVQQAGPGVRKIDVAMTDTETATPVLRSISMIVPQVHITSSLKYLATSTFPFVRGAQAEIGISDSVTGKLLAEGLDKRIGGAFRSGFQWQWGDAEKPSTFGAKCWPSGWRSGLQASKGPKNG